jgi:hypothetical protein
MGQKIKDLRLYDSLILGRRAARQAAEFDDSVQRSGIKDRTRLQVAGGAVADQSDTKVCIFQSR